MAALAGRVRMFLSFARSDGVPTPLVRSFYCSLFLSGGSDDIRRVIILAISESTVLVGIQFLMYAVEGPSPIYFVGS